MLRLRGETIVVNLDVENETPSVAVRRCSRNEVCELNVRLGLPPPPPRFLSDRQQQPETQIQEILVPCVSHFQ